CQSYQTKKASLPEKGVLLESAAMRNWILGSAMLVLGLTAHPVAAWWRPGAEFLPPPIHYEERTVTCYRPEYRTEYREVQRTVYRCVPATHEQEIKDTVP